MRSKAPIRSRSTQPSAVIPSTKQGRQISFKTQRSVPERVRPCTVEGTHHIMSDPARKVTISRLDLLRFGVEGLVECGVFPSVDDSVVVTDRAFPADSGYTIVPGYFDGPSTWFVVWATSAFDCGDPPATRGTAGGSFDDQAKEFTHPPCRPRHSVGHVKKMAEIRNKHAPDPTRA